MAKQHNGAEGATSSEGAKRMLSFDDIMRAPDHRTIEVEVPEWGGTVRLRTISAGEREEWESFARDDYNKGKLYARYVAMCLVDENDQRIVPDEQLEFFARRASGPIRRLFERAQLLNGAGPEAADAAKNA